MITIISGTNRKNSITKKIALFYQKMLKGKNHEAALIDLEDLPYQLLSSVEYTEICSHEAFVPFQKQIDQSEKFIFIVPEYNGSFPGVLKTFIDGLRFPDTFQGKKCAIVGISSGIQGAALAMSHLTDIFNYIGMNVMAQKPKLSLIDAKMDGDQLMDDLYIQLLEEQAEAFIGF